MAVNLNCPRLQTVLRICKELIAEGKFPEGSLILERIENTGRSNDKSLAHDRQLLFKHGKLSIPTFLFRDRDADARTRDRQRKRERYKKNQSSNSPRRKPCVNYGLLERDNNEIKDRIAVIREIKRECLMSGVLNKELMNRALDTIDKIYESRHMKNSGP